MLLRTPLLVCTAGNGKTRVTQFGIRVASTQRISDSPATRFCCSNVGDHVWNWKWNISRLEVCITIVRAMIYCPVVLLHWLYPVNWECTWVCNEELRPLPAFYEVSFPKFSFWWDAWLPDSCDPLLCHGCRRGSQLGACGQGGIKVVNPNRTITTKYKKHTISLILICIPPRRRRTNWRVDSFWML